MAHGASVVTANKALLAEDGPTLYAAADAEPASTSTTRPPSPGPSRCCARSASPSPATTSRKVLGIVNGTTNFVLDKMDSDRRRLRRDRRQAQALGYAEADPTADVEGFDAAAKAAILASLAFHTRVAGRDVHREGITEVTAADIAAAKEMDCVVKLLAIAEKASTCGDGEGVSVRVHPAMIPRSHPLASVREAFNAVFVEASAAGQLMFYGRGAGGDPTASAVLGDRRRGRPAQGERIARAGGVGIRRPARSGLGGAVVDRYHISLDVLDRPGVLAQVATAFASHDVSIETVRQRVVTNPDSGGPRAELIVVTHRASEAALNRPPSSAVRVGQRRRRRVRHACGRSLTWPISGAVSSGSMPSACRPWPEPRSSLFTRVAPR
jgi:homoserine dehydrogenase